MHSSNYIQSKSLNFIISCLMYHWPNIYQIKYFNHCKQWCWRFSNRALLWFTLQGGQELGNKVQGHCPPHHPPPPPSSHRTALPPPTCSPPHSQWGRKLCTKHGRGVTTEGRYRLEKKKQKLELKQSTGVHEHNFNPGYSVTRCSQRTQLCKQAYGASQIMFQVDLQSKGALLYCNCYVYVCTNQLNVVMPSCKFLSPWNEFPNRTHHHHHTDLKWCTLVKPASSLFSKSKFWGPAQDIAFVRLEWSFLFLLKH